MSGLLDPAELIRRYGKPAKKALGQNFLADIGTLDRVVQAAREDTQQDVQLPRRRLDLAMPLRRARATGRTPRDVVLHRAKRVEAEVIRDSILQASDTLDRTIGGRSYRIHNVKKRYRRGVRATRARLPMRSC
mgnify:CR=1 FL=1